jgi:hypothetical protein
VLLCDSNFVHCLLLLYSFQFPHYLSFKFSDLHIILKKIKSTLHSESKLENWLDGVSLSILENANDPNSNSNIPMVDLYSPM